MINAHRPTPRKNSLSEKPIDALDGPSHRAATARTRLAVAALALGSLGCISQEDATPETQSSEPAAQNQICGSVVSGPNQSSLNGYRVTVYTGDETGSTAGNTDTTDMTGSFCVSSTQPTDQNTITYLVAQNEQDARQALAAVMGFKTYEQNLIINELTTVTTAYTMAQFTVFDSQGVPSIYGKSPGLRNATWMAENFVVLGTGAASTILANESNASTHTQGTFDSLANLIAGCLSTPGNCDEFLQAAKLDGDPPPANTLQALSNIAHSPQNNKADLLSQSLSYTPYLPALTESDAQESEAWAWILALRFAGKKETMNGPGDMIIDKSGQVWVTNNYTYFNEAGTDAVCGSPLVLLFMANGEYAPGTPFDGTAAGVYGAGIGIDYDVAHDTIWIGNFGFQGKDCTKNPDDYNNTVSQLQYSNGRSVSGSPYKGDGSIFWPQGTVVDGNGSVWIANCGNNSVTVFPNGDPGRAQHYPVDPTAGVARSLAENGVLGKPFGIAYNDDNTFVVGNSSNQVTVLNYENGSLNFVSSITDSSFKRPMEITADSRGNMWVANSQMVHVPCPTPKDPGATNWWKKPLEGSLSLIQSSGSPLNPEVTEHKGGGMSLPWGITVDGEDDVWVANFNGMILSHFCGTNNNNCSAGTPISDTGYFFDGLVRNTGVAVDPSGNVWVTNNWEIDPDLNNPGGKHMVAFVGMAPPMPGKGAP